MIVTLIKQDTINTLTLPDKFTGQYWLQEADESGCCRDLISIEGINGQWILKSNRMASVMDQNSTVRQVELKPNSFYKLARNAGVAPAFVFTEPVSRNRQQFSKWTLADNTSLSIGRAETCDIVFANRYVSSVHARLSLQNGIWQISDMGSTNGTYVAGRRIVTRVLAPGDTVYIMGLKLIVGERFLAINNPDELMSVRSSALKPYQAPAAKPIPEDEDCEWPSPAFFYRSPRFKRTVEKAEFRIDSPPQNLSGEETPLMLVLGPALTMGLTSVTTGLFAVNNAVANGNIQSALPSIVMSFSMLLGTILWPTLSKRYDRQRKIRKEAERQEKYKRYLDRMGDRIHSEGASQSEIMLENHVTVDECVSRIRHQSRNLWERSPGQDDFLRLRFGLGTLPMPVDIKYSERRFSLEQDNLVEALLDLCETPKVLEHVPVTLSLADEHIAGAIGEREAVKTLAKSLVLQLASLYSYDEVKLVFLYDPEDELDFGFVKWLPHVWSNARDIRLIATNAAELKEVSAYLEREIELRASVSEDARTALLPYYVIFTLSRGLAARADMLKQLYLKKNNLNISVMSFFDELRNLPRECSTVVELSGSSGKIFDRNDTTGKSTAFDLDTPAAADFAEQSIRLANIRLDTADTSARLPAMVSFLDMYGVGKVEHLNARTRWKENDPTKSLEAAVGVDAFGDPFMLDLHEKFHGPHGLVAGMTGSGKSEFIMSFILSLALNYHPDEVGFILIDYKGGGMAKAFESLPHVAGIITNLDGAFVKRSLISIESELKRRQQLFAEAGKKIGVSNLDIYRYQKLRRDGLVSEPLQHLFIISDEFAELRTQQPEFMAQLISTARIGRSLGIHLVLATQKPSGVVDDQIWSNSKFRVCLKVQERADSMDMLKRPDAAELSQTGRFYLQVGYNELFEIGQSAWAGAPYYPSERVVVEKNAGVSVLDRNGRVISQARIDRRRRQQANPGKQLDAITQYLGTIAREERIAVHRLWLEPMPATITVDALREKYHLGISGAPDLKPLIGELDDPARQRQGALLLPISEDGNVVVFGSPGSGKTMLLTAMIYSLIFEHTPEDVNLYILDFASETLRAFAKAPQVGDVIHVDEAEKVRNLFKQLLTTLALRKRQFADYGGDIRDYRSETGEKVPSLLVVIDNFTAFSETFEDLEATVTLLAREGAKYGIHFVLTAIGTAAVRFRLLQSFRQQLILQMNDESEYATVVGKTDGLVPSRFKGRGLVKQDAIYEFQTASVTPSPVPFRFIQEKCLALRNQWTGELARKVPILPERVDLSFLIAHLKPHQPLQLPIGVDMDSLDVFRYAFDSVYLNLILSAGKESGDLLSPLLRLLGETGQVAVTVLDLAGSHYKQTVQTDMVQRIGQALDPIACESAIHEWYELAVYRNNSTKEQISRGEKPAEQDQRVLVIRDLASIRAAVSKEANEMLALILERGERKFGMTVLLVDTARSMNSFMHEKWYKRHVTQQDGIWIGGGFSDQFHLKLRKGDALSGELVSPDHGLAVVGGMPVQLKLVSESGGDA